MINYQKGCEEKGFKQKNKGIQAITINSKDQDCHIKTIKINY